MGPDRSKNSIRYPCYKLQPKLLKLLLIFSSHWFAQNNVWDFKNFEIPIFSIFFFENFEFSIVAYGESKTSIIWKMSDRRAALSAIWDSWVLAIHIWCAVDLITSKVILGSFGSLAIFNDRGVMVTDRRKYFTLL